MLWKNQKQAVYARKPTNIPQLKLFCEQEWTKIHAGKVKVQATNLFELIGLFL